MLQKYKSYRVYSYNKIFSSFFIMLLVNEKAIVAFALFSVQCRNKQSALNASTNTNADTKLLLASSPLYKEGCLPKLVWTDPFLVGTFQHSFTSLTNI